MPFYVAPEQMMKDRAEYARKGIARGRAMVALEFADGVVFVGENPSMSLYKTSEIYDRIAFAGVGKYNEFERMRVAGIRMADVKGYQYARQDVTAKSLANSYSQALGEIFMSEQKPFEVELVIAQVNDVDGGEAGNDKASDDSNGAAAGRGGVPGADLELYHILYDGSIVDEHRFVVIGGQSDELSGALGEEYEEGMSLVEAIRMGISTLSGVTDRELPAEDLEVSGLDRTRGRRKFFRLRHDELGELLGES